MTHDSYKARQREILKNFLDETDFVLEAEPPIDDKDFFDRPYTEAAQALDSLFLEVIGEDDRVPFATPDGKLKYEGRNELRASIRSVVTGGKE